MLASEVVEEALSEEGQLPSMALPPGRCGVGSALRKPTLGIPELLPVLLLSLTFLPWGFAFRGVLPPVFTHSSLKGWFKCCVKQGEGDEAQSNGLTSVSEPQI